jgi:hypothetical protein
VAHSRRWLWGWAGIGVYGVAALRGLAFAAAGAVVGALGTLAGGRILGTVLYGVEPADAATLGGVCLMAVLLAGLTSTGAVRRVSRTSPAQVLNAE